MACTCHLTQLGAPVPATKHVRRGGSHARKPLSIVCTTSLWSPKRPALHSIGLGLIHSSRRTRSKNGIRRIVPNALPATISGLLDLGVITAATQASFKLLFLCGVVAWLSERGMIPANASQVMSKVRIQHLPEHYTQ